VLLDSNGAPPSPLNHYGSSGCNTKGSSSGSTTAILWLLALVFLLSCRLSKKSKP
jgi:hypothetical protein